MSQVPTVRGPVDVADFGPTYMHEQIFNFTADVQPVALLLSPGPWRRILAEDERGEQLCPCPRI